ncbi:MAG: hypothetical protein NZ736_06115 [Candidatus Poseidoniaceae archaeon]|nr:hypothetical protein [Candidatus Poseidoniaceae archaeon]
MSLRQPPSNLSSWIRVFVAAFIALHIAQSAWLVVEFDGAYTEGRPAPTEFHALIAMDKDQMLIDVDIEKATAFLLYTYTRNSSVDGTETSTAQESTASGEDTNYLENSKSITLLFLLLMVLSEILIMINLRFAIQIRASVWAITLLCFVLLLPISFIADLGDGDQNYYSNTEGMSYVHESTKTDMGLFPLGISIEMEYSGYDLGLVAAENHSAVIESPPDPGTKDAQSFIKFDSIFSAGTGKNINSLFVLPLTWFFLPAGNSRDEKTIPLTILESE